MQYQSPAMVARSPSNWPNGLPNEGRLPQSCHRMAVEGIQFPWRWNDGMISPNLGVIREMLETQKTNQLRGERFLETYLSGKVIDIGCGDDRVVPHAEPFDQQHGDANLIDVLREPGSYDCVYSSHCLEHMHDPVDALARWWRLVMSSGFLIIVVPDEDLYEQGVWPSRFNSDHKATFRLGREDSWSPCSYDIVELVANLSGAKVISAEVQDQGYDHTMERIGAEGAWSNLLRQQMMGLYRRLSEQNLLTVPLLTELNRCFFDLGATIDQTLGPALAQIQVVAQKTGDGSE